MRLMNISDRKVSIRFEAPREVVITRGELLEAPLDQRLQAREAGRRERE
jgi:sRNA-binding carbon storage regulator CsrA